jgi:hypothetical protein
VLTRIIERDVLPAAQRHGMGILTYGPLSRGWLSGRTDPTAGHRAADVTLPPGVLDLIDELVPPGTAVNPADDYNADPPPSAARNSAAGKPPAVSRLSRSAASDQVNLARGHWLRDPPGAPSRAADGPVHQLLPSPCFISITTLLLAPAFAGR